MTTVLLQLACWGSGAWLGWMLCDVLSLRRKRAELDRQIESWRAAVAQWEAIVEREKARR